jgi:hypothetical protein
MLDRLEPLFRSLNSHEVEYLVIADDVLKHEITIFRDRIRVDVQTKTPGIDFRQEYERRNTVHVGETGVHLISLDGLIRSKKAAARPRDLEDVNILEASRPRP